MAAGIQLAPLLTELKVETGSFKSDMAKAAALGKSEADKIEKGLAGLTKTGQTLSELGGTLTKGVTVPIAGLGIATTKMAMDFDSSFAKVSTLLDDNVVNFNVYKDSLLDGSNQTKVAVDEYSEAVYQAISAGVDQTKAVEFTTEAMKLAKGGFTSGASAVDILTTAINGYNMTAEDSTKISDMLITTQNLGKTTVDELSSSMGKVIPIAASVNFGMDELSASYAQLTKNGIATAEAGTYLKSMLSELGKSGSETDKALRKLTGKGFAELKSEGIATSDVLNMLSGYAEQNGKTLKDMFGSVEAGSAALVLAKGNGQEYNEMLNAMKSSAGATQEAFDKMDATPAEQLKGALNELKNEGVKLGATFIPVVTEVAKMVSKAAKSFSELSDEQKQNIIKWAGVAAAAGPVLKLVGGGITTFTSLAKVVGGAGSALSSLGQMGMSSASALGTTASAAGAAGNAIGAGGLVGSMGSLSAVCVPLIAGVAAVGTGLYVMHENSQLMGRSVVEASDDMSLMERALAKLNGVEICSREELENLGLVHKQFSDELSPEFQKAVEESTKKVQDFSVFLREIGFDNVITSEESSEFNNRINQTCDEAIQTIQSKKDESQAALKELFVADDGVIDESEQKVLEILSRSSDAQIEEINRLKEEIIAIKQKAVDEGRALNEEEIAAVEEKTARIAQIELESLGGTQEEIAYAKNEFAARVKTMDAESASELLQQKIQARDEEIIQIQAGYDTQIDMLKSKLGDCTKEERAALQEQITNLEKDRDDKIQIQKDLYNDYLGIIEENNPAILSAINEYNGKILTQEEKASIERLQKQKSHYFDLTQITKDGYYDVYNAESQQMETIVADVDEKTGQIVGIMDTQTGEVNAYTKDIANHVEEMARNYDHSYGAIMGDHMKYSASTGQVVDANGRVVGSMYDVTEATDGTRQGIIDINGTAYNIKVNKDGTIASLNAISSTADYAARTRTIHFNSVIDNAPGSLYNRVSASHYNGLDNVPYDGYRAVLHKNERVLTAEENKEYTMSREQPKDNTPKTLHAVINIGKSQFVDVVVPIVDEAMSINAELRERGV